MVKVNGKMTSFEITMVDKVISFEGTRVKIRTEIIVKIIASVKTKKSSTLVISKLVLHLKVKRWLLFWGNYLLRFHYKPLDIIIMMQWVRLALTIQVCFLLPCLQQL